MKTRPPKGIIAFSESDLLKLVHELEVHQIELEMQNDELQINKKRAAQLADDRYAKLYDLAPTGYLTLSKEGEILELNLCGARMLGKERLHLIKSRFGFFVSEDTKPVFNGFLDEIFADKTSNICEVTLIGSDKISNYVQLTGVKSNLEGQCLITMADITARKMIEERLRESENSYRNLISDLHAGVLVQGPSSEILVSNNRALELLGLTEDQLLGKTSFDADWNVIHEDGSPYPGSTHPVPQSIATRQPVRNAVMGVYRPTTGDRVWLLVNADPELNSDGKVKVVICTFEDITVQKQIEKALRESEDRFRTVVEFSPNAIVVYRDGKIIFVNPAAIKMFGAKSASDLLGLPILERIHPDYHEIILNRIQQAIDSGSHGSLIEAKYFRLDGTIIDAQVKGIPIVFNGEAAIQASIYDITERKLVEEKLNQLSTRLVLATRAGHVGVWELDIVSNILLWDDQMFALYGADKKDFSGVYEAWISGVHPDDMSRCHIENQLAISGEKELDTEYRVVWPNGTVHNIRALAVVQRDNAGNPLRMTGTNWDITDQKHAEEEMNLKNSQLQKVNAEKDKFFSVIAHDLRSPFNGFLGLTELMCEELEDLSPEEIRSAALLMRNSAKNLFDLLSNLLEWSRMQRGLIPFLPTSVLLIAKFEESSNMLKESIVKKEITLIDEIPPHLKVWAEENMLNSILRNLMSNAIKFTPKGGNIVVSAKSRPDQMIEISIRDSGIGMSKQLIDNLFKLDAKTGRKGTEGELSTGLGLFICKDFVEKNGGEIWVQSEIGIGTTFQFSLLPSNE